MPFVKATKKQSKLRLAIYGPSGAGKTVTSLRVLSGMASKIAVIDTERGRAAKCASDWCDFDVCEVDSPSIEGVVRLMEEAAHAGYDAIVIDSITHLWHTLLDEINRLAKAKYKGNTWSAWSEGTPMQTTFVNAILSYPGHVFATMRSATEWTQEKDERSGKSKPVRVGLKPDQGKGIEYEFDFLMSITPEHFATIEKGPKAFQDRIVERPGEDFGKELLAWLDSGEEDPNSPEWKAKTEAIYKAIVTEHNKEELNALLREQPNSKARFHALEEYRQV